MKRKPAKELKDCTAAELREESTKRYKNLVFIGQADDGMIYQVLKGDNFTMIGMATSITHQLIAATENARKEHCDAK